MPEYDIAIIGGGPVGMFTAFYAGLRGASVLLLESRGELGGQPQALYPQKNIYDVGGFFAVTGQDLSTALTQQLSRFNPSIALETKVTDLIPDENGVLLHTNASDYRAKRVIVATGAGAFEPKPLAAPHDPALIGHQIQYTVKDLNAFADQDVLIAGGGDSAIDWALALEPVAKSVGLIHRRDQFRALESSVTALESSRITRYTPYIIQNVTAAGRALDVTLRPLKGDHAPTLRADRLLVSYGFASDNRQLRAWGLDLMRGQIKVGANYATNLPHVYAVGDAITYPDKQKLIATGFGEAPAAVNAIMRDLYPDRRQNLHSSDANFPTS